MKSAYQVSEKDARMANTNAFSCKTTGLQRQNKFFKHLGEKTNLTLKGKEKSGILNFSTRISKENRVTYLSTDVQKV